MRKNRFQDGNLFRIPRSAFRIQLFRIQAGFSIIWMLVLIPAVLVLFLTVQNRLQMTMAEAQRGEDRAQSRLLAESALLMLRDNLKTKGLNGWEDRAMPMGEIAGKGDYQVSILDLDSTASPRHVVALGRVEGRQGRFICEIHAEVGATTPTMTAPTVEVTKVTDIKYRIKTGG